MVVVIHIMFLHLHQQEILHPRVVGVVLHLILRHQIITTAFIAIINHIRHRRRPLPLLAQVLLLVYLQWCQIRLLLPRIRLMEVNLV